MEIVDQSAGKKLIHLGKGSEFALIFFKNIILIFLTLGIYYPWARVEQLKYLYSTTEFNGTRFSFTGTGKEVFKGYLKLYALFLIFFVFFTYASLTENNTAHIITLAVFYSFAILILPFAIHGAVRYRAIKTNWNGVHFNYTGISMEMFRLCIKGFLLTIVTLGIYSSWLNVSIRKYIFSHLKFGNLSFDFKGKGDQLFWIQLKFVLLFTITAGIYTFWYLKNIFKFYVENLKMYQDNKEINFKVHATGGSIFLLLITNMLLIVFTLGLATPWAAIRTIKFITENSSFVEDLDIKNIGISNEDNYNNTTGHNFIDFLNLDLL